MIANGASELLAEIRGLTEIPKDFHPRSWWGEQWELGSSQTRKYINIGIAKKKIEMKIFPIQIKGNIRPVPHYRQCSSS